MKYGRSRDYKIIIEIMIMTNKILTRAKVENVAAVEAGLFPVLAHSLAQRIEVSLPAQVLGKMAQNLR